MKLIDRLNALREFHKYNTAVQVNGTSLVGLCPKTPPLAMHYIYAPMRTGVQKHLIESYKLTFPEELLRLYEYANGFDLFF